MAFREPIARLSRALEGMVTAVLEEREQADQLDALAAIVGEALSADRVLIYVSDEAAGLGEWQNPDNRSATTGGADLLDVLRRSAQLLGTTSSRLESHVRSPHPALSEEGSAALLHGSLGIRSLLWCPFAFDADGFGLLAVHQIAYERAWLPSDVAFLQAAARMISLAIRHRQLLDSCARADTALLETQRLQSIRVLAEGAAHDLASMMRGVHWAVERARELLPPESPAVPCLDDIERAVRGSTDLVRQMLTYAGKGDHRIETVALGPLAEDLQGLLRVVAGCSVRLVVEDPASVEGDANHLRQVLINLVSNAAEAATGDGREAGVRVRVGRRRQTEGEDRLRGGVEIQVSDSGTGIAAEIRDRILEPFFSTKGAGRGLGLTAVVRTVHEHGGEVHIDSTVGQGTTVTVVLPYSDESAVAATSS